ncbi:TPA: hypothetical protein CPT80_05375 [Candidatus Gastranaerophilales bacterium HUM_9]|nr:MAG TPA: hypothetical protein CPT80_05375 [Candidatus Gastranaerophilales bacterium HUM_9]HBX34289.1 hypothetical protein [Cyanobacteria bacterium UBA11440]
MTSTSSVQDKIQVFINSHPEYEGRPLSEISSELVSAGVLTTEELGTLDSTSTFSIANKAPQKDDNVDSFEHAENTNSFQATETTETIIEHGNEVILKKKGDELVEKVIKEKIPNSEEVKTITITYSKGKPFTKKVQSGDEVLETSLYTSETLENGEEVIAIKTMNGDGKSVEQTIAKNVDENGDYTDEDFEYRKTLYLEDDVTGSNIKVKAGSVKEVGKTKDGLVETVSDSTGEHVVSTQYNGGSVTKYDEDKLYFKRQEVADKGKITNSAEYDGKGNTYVTIRNGDGAGTITKYFNDYIKKHGLDKSRQFTTAEFEKLNKKALSTTGLQVGKKALVPTQYNANAPILTKRGTTQQAMNKYAQFAFEQTKERLASSTITETTLNKTYSSYVELAREQLTVQGVHNPSNEQVNNRANELMALNTKNGKLTALKKGAKFSVVSNQASASDVGKLKSAGLNPTFDNNAFYKKFNSLSSQDRQKVMNIISACKGMKNVDKVKAIVYENTGVNLYDTNLTVNEYGTTSAVGMNMREEFKQKMPLEYFLTKRMGLDLNSKSGREVYARLRLLPQGELDKISASQFTPEGVPNFGRSATGSISVSKNVTAKDIIGTMQTQGVELRTADEIRAERSNPRYQDRQRKEQAISMLYDSVKSAYDLINDHLDELKSHMISNAGEILFEDLKIYGVPDVVKQLASYLSNGDGTVEGLTKSIYDKRDELQRTLFQINQLRNSKHFEADYKKLTGHDYNSKDIQAYMDMKSSLKNPVTRTIKTPKQLEQMQEQAGNMFVKLVGGDRANEAKKFKKVGETGGSVLEMAAMIYLTGGMGELGYIKNAGSAALKATGSRALATGVRGALTLGTYTAGRESLNTIDDLVNAGDLKELKVALGDRGIKVLEHTGSSALFGFVGGATAEKVFTMSKTAQNFVSKGFSKIFGKGSEKAVSTFVADSSSTAGAFKPSAELVAAADKALGKGAELTGSQFMSKAMMGAHSLNAVGKTVSLALETLTFSGVEISEQGVIALANEIFNDESELKQAIANNTLEDYIKTKVKNAPQSVINTLKEQGINMLMLKAVSFAVGAHAANNMDGQYETLDKSKVYKTEINGETKVVVETTNGKLYCNSTADALTFLNQSMAVETMMKSAETTKPESEFEWAQKTAVTDENSTGYVHQSEGNLPVYTRANLPENAVIMPSTNLVISTVTNKPIGRLEVKQSLVDEARAKGFTDEQIKMLEAKGLDVNAINEYMRIGLKPVSKPIETSFDEARLDAVASSSAGIKENTSQYKPTSNPAITKRPQKEVFRINEVLTDEELSIKASDILEKVGDRYKLNKKGDEIAFKLAEQIHKVAQEAEPDIVSTIKKMGLADGERFSFRSKSVQSLHDKIQNALADSMEKGGSLTFEQALDDVRDAEGIRTIFEAKDYTNHPEVQELLQKGDEKGAVRRASELQSNDTFEALKGYIDSVADGTNDVELFKMSNYMGKDGIPYFSEEQLMTLKHYAASKGVKIPIFERVTVKEEVDGTKTVEKNPKATTKVRGSGYTAFQANFRTKNGFIFEGQWRGSIVDPFAEAEHVPYDIRTGKDIIGVHTELTNIYKPIIESLAGENKISDVMFDEHTNYLTEYYEYSRKTELGFEDGKNPPKFPAGLDTRLRAENLLLLHEYVEKIKKEPEREAELRAEYESKLVQNTPENTKQLNKRQIDDIAEHLDLSKDGKYLDLVFEQYGKDIEKLLDVQTTEEHIELNKALNENYSEILNKINELTESSNPDISAKASEILFNKVLPLAERYQQIAAVVDNRASVKDGYFKKEKTFDETAFRETLKSYTQHKTNNIPRFTDKEIDELVDLRKKYPEVESLLNHKKGIPLQLRLDEIRYLVSYAEKKPELYNVVINNFDELGLAYATEILESRVTGAKDIKFLENIAGLKGINFRGEEAPMFSGEVMSKLTLLHQKDPVLAENLVERFKVAKDQNFVMQTIAKISPKSHSKVNELISEKETLVDGTEQYALSSGQINMLMTIYEGSPEISEKLKTILKDKTIDDKTKTSFQKQLISILRETGVITSKVVRAGNGIDTAIENLNHVENPTTPEENLLSKVGVEADFVIKKYAEKYGDKSFAKFSAHTIKLLSEFNKTKHDKSYTDYVEGLLENSIDENTVLDFLSQDEAGQKNIIQNFENTKTKIKDRYFYLQSSNAKSQLTNNDIIKNLALMEIHNPESFEKLIHSKGFKMIQQGRMNVNVLSSVRPMDKVDDDYFYNLFEAKEQDFNAKYESSTALKEYDKDMLFKIIDLDPAKQDEVLNYIEKAKDPRLMKTLIEKRINKIVEKQEEIDSTNSFETPDAAQKRKENAIELIRIASRSPEIINKVLKFNGSSVDALTSFADTELSVRLTPREKESVYALFNDAQQKYKNIYITDVQAALKYLEKSHDFDLLKQLTSSKQDFRYSLILKSVTQNNVDLLKNALKNIGGKVSVSQLSMLEAAKDYPEMKDFRSEVAQGILQTIDEVCRNSKTNVLNKIKGLKDELKLELDRIKNDETLSIEQKASASNKAFSNMYRQMSIISGEIYVETANRKGLVEIKLKDPAKYERLKESGILDMVDSGELDSSILKHLNVNSDLTPEVYADLEAVKNGESIIPEFKTGTTIPYAFSRTKVGDAVAIGDKMYINDGNNLVEWKMTKEKYLELFPPVKRFLTQQRALGDCYFVSSLTNSMYNPQARVGIYQSFEQNGNDISVTIKDYNEYGGTKTYKDSKIDLDNRRLHVAGAKGIQMYEQTYAKVALRDFRQDTTPMTDDKDIVVTMQRIPGGQPSNAMTEMHSLGVTGYYNEVPNDFKTGSIGIRNITQEKLATLLDRFSNQDNTLIGFNTNPKPNAKAESTLDSKYNLVSSHAYIIRGYNQEKGTVIINNPHNSGTNTEVPIDVLANHMSMFNISVLNDEPTLLKVSNDSNFDSVKTSAKGSAEDLTTNESDTSKTPELTREYLSSLKEISFGGVMESNRFSPEEIEKVLELSKQNPKLVKYLIDATEMDYSSSFKSVEVTRFDYDDIVRIVDYAKENPELITRLLEYRDESPFSRNLTARFSFPEIKAIADLAKEKPELIDTLLELKHNDSSYVMNSNTIIDIATNENLSKNAITQIKSLSNRNYGGWDIVNNLNKSNVEEAIEALRKSYTYEDLAPLTSVQNKFLDALLDLTKDSPIAIDVLTSSGVAKSLRELKPEHYSKVLSFIEKFPNSVDRLNYIFRRLNSDESTEMEEFLRSSSYMDEMKRNSAGKYQKELLEMFSPENLSDESIESLLKLSATKEDFLNAIKKMSKSTFKLAYERPNQYLSGIDTKYTDPVNGKLPELPESVLISQRNQIKKFFIENMDSLVRLLKYVDTDTVSHMMDRRTDLFEENMEKLNGISDENYELLSKALQCKSSVSGKQLSPKEKMQLTQIMFILNEAKIDTSSLKAEVEKGSVDINNSKTTIQNAVLKAAGVDVTDSSISTEKKQFNPEYAYLALMNQSETFENSIADKIERITPKMMERISLLRNDRELLRQEIERSETMMDYVPESMRKINIELLDMVKNIDKHSDEEILSKMLATVNAALKLSQEITGRNGLFTVINAATTGNFKEFINDTSNKYGQANANTAQIFKDNGLDYNQWLNPSVDDVKLNVAGKDMSIRLWDRNPQEDLFMGNKTTCCTAIGTGGNAAATPLYLLNTSYNVAMLHDAKGNVVGMSRVFMTNIDGKPSLTMDNIELNNTYIKGMSNSERAEIRDGFFEYMNRYAAKITGDNNSQVYFYSGDIGDRFPTIDLKPTKKTVDFIGDFSDEQVYVNAKECSWIDPKNLKDVGKIPWYIVPRK